MGSTVCATCCTAIPAQNAIRRACGAQKSAIFLSGGSSPLLFHTGAACACTDSSSGGSSAFRRLIPTPINQLWVADITYVRLGRVDVSQRLQRPGRSRCDRRWRLSEQRYDQSPTRSICVSAVTDRDYLVVRTTEVPATSGTSIPALAGEEHDDPLQAP